jgi:geranylgeranyl diphosphate synthase, type II
MAKDFQKISLFYTYRDKIELEIAKSILGFGEKTKLRDACEWALKSGGKRLRALLVVLVAEALGNDLPVWDAALSVEFFHNASLIIDDLPCMDNEEDRRDQPSLHKVFGETIALLSSYALITAAFEKIHTNTINMQQAAFPFNEKADRVGLSCLHFASYCAGINGATGGQFLDLFPPKVTLNTIRQVIYKKTITLFEVSFLFGWFFGGGDWEKEEEVRKLAWHFGMAFQIADDLEDLLEDEKKQKEINFAKNIGKNRALIVFDEELKLFRKTLINLGLESPSFEKMSDMLQDSVMKNFSNSV